MRYRRVRIYLRPVLIALLTLCHLYPATIAQKQLAPLTVAEANKNAARLGSSQVSVRGHLWVGKEGSMIYDSGFKATLRLQYAAAFNAKHSFQELLGKTRKSDLATITGRLALDSNGRLALIADDIQFVEKPK